MNYREILEAFCSKEEARANLHSPHVIGDYAYATNGHVCVRVAVLELDNAEFPEPCDPYPGADTITQWDEIKWDSLSEKIVGEVPGADYPKCRKCKGTGKCATCPECEGEGRVTTETDYNDYENECATCWGKGQIEGNGEPCGYCDGTGKEKWPDKSAMDMGKYSISGAVARLISKHIPGVRFASETAMNDMAGGYVYFTNGTIQGVCIEKETE